MGGGGVGGDTSTIGVSALGSLTHVIVDEIHERDRFSDFLLTVLRDALNKFRGLKLILMSATVDVQLFMYDQCPPILSWYIGL